MTEQSPVKQLEETRTRLEIAEAEAVLKLLESPTPVKVPWNQYPAYEDFEGYTRFPYLFTDIQDRQGERYRPLYENNNDLRRMRARARNMEATFPVAISAKERLTDYVIGSGVSFEVNAKQRGAEQLAVQAQQELEDFCEYNTFCGGMDREIHEDSRVEGECFATLYPEDDNVRCELTDPDAIVEPAHKQQLARHLGHGHKLNHWWLGVHTQFNHTLKRDDPCRPLGYHAVFDELGEQWDYLPASRVQHIKRNVGRKGRRGWSDYDSVLEDLENLYKLKRNTAVGAAILAAIVLIRQHSASTSKSSIENMIASQATSSYDRQIEGGTRNRYVENTAPGTVKDIPQGMEAMLGPLGTLRSPVYIEVAQFVLRLVAVRWNVPEFMISGDASNSNLNSATMAAESFGKSRESDQGFYITHFEKLAWKVLRMRHHAGAFGAAPWQRVKAAITIKAILPDVQNVDTEALARENEILVRNKVKSRRTWASELGLDYDEERRQLESEPQQESLRLATAPFSGQPDTNQAAISAALESVSSTAEAMVILENLEKEN